MSPDDLLTTAEAAAYLRRPTGEALRTFLRRHHARWLGTRCGRGYVYRRRDLDGFLSGLAYAHVPQSRRAPVGVHLKAVACDVAASQLS